MCGATAGGRLRGTVARFGRDGPTHMWSSGPAASVFFPFIFSPTTSRMLGSRSSSYREERSHSACGARAGRVRFGAGRAIPETSVRGVGAKRVRSACGAVQRQTTKKLTGMLAHQRQSSGDFGLFALLVLVLPLNKSATVKQHSKLPNKTPMHQHSSRSRLEQENPAPGGRDARSTVTYLPQPSSGFHYSGIQSQLVLTLCIAVETMQ